MRLRELAAAARARRARRGRSLIRSRAGCSTRCRSAFPTTAASSRRGSRKRSRALVVILLFRINRIGYKLDAVLTRLRHRRRLLGRREHLLSDLLPRLWRRHLAGARARHRGDARHHAPPSSPPSRTRFAERENRERRGRVRLPLVVVRPRLSRRGRAPHHLQPIPRPAAAGDDRRADGRRRSLIMRDLPLRPGRGARAGSTRSMAAHRAAARRARCGRWPDGTSAARIARARRAAGPRSASAAIRDLLPHPRLAGGRGRGNDDRGSRRRRRARPRPRSRAAFADARPPARARLGRSTFAALDRLLPFSRNDHWEVAELRQRLARR